MTMIQDYLTMYKDYKDMLNQLLRLPALPEPIQVICQQMSDHYGVSPNTISSRYYTLKRKQPIGFADEIAADPVIKSMVQDALHHQANPFQTHTNPQEMQSNNEITMMASHLSHLTCSFTQDHVQIIQTLANQYGWLTMGMMIASINPDEVGELWVEWMKRRLQETKKIAS